MTQLRQRMIEDMQLRGLSEQTQSAYVTAVRQLAEHYNKSPAQITERELRQYFLYLKNEKKVSRSTCTVALCAIKFLYVQTLGRSWPTFDLVRPPRERKVPVILSRAEVQQVLGCLRRLRYRACLSTIYSCGLRIQEGVSLQVSHIDSSRMLIHVHQGKNGKERYVPLPPQTLTLLRSWWVTHRNPVWLFPAGVQSYQTTATTAVHPSSVRRAFYAALAESGIQKAACVHSLRHAYATHLLEAGVNPRLIQSYMGHSSLATTTHYTHLTNTLEASATATIGQVLEELP